MKKLLTYILPVTMTLLSCGGGGADKTGVADTVTATTHSDVSEVQTVLPQAGHVALVESHCMPCHSLRYIEMQPDLTYAAWERIVDKMINLYKAPIRDTVTRRQIIDYLHAIKGID